MRSESQSGIPFSGHPIAQLLSSDGAGGGTINMAGAANTYYIRPASNQTIAICLLRMTIADTGTFSTTVFGGAAALATGVQLHMTMGGRGVGNSQFDFHAGVTVLNSGLLIDAGWRRSDIQSAIAGTGAGDDWQTWKYDILGRLGVPIVLRRGLPSGGGVDPAIEMITNDDMSALASMYVTAYGFIL